SQLPAGLTGLLIAAIFSAGMSSLSTSVNSSATVLLSDYYRKLKKTELSERSAINFLRLSSLVIGILGIIVALAFNGVASALDTWWALASIFSGGILGLFLLGLMLKNIKPKTAMIAVGVGLLFILWTSLSPFFGFSSLFHANWVIVFGTLLIFGVGWGISTLKD
ncbi:MAG: SSS family solute:Na+ symporter, partial [Arcticibacterium sp.]